MSDPILISNITIMAVGVNSYTDSHFRYLNGPRHDINNLYKLLVENPSTAIFKPQQFIKLFNPTSYELRQTICNYIMGRGADNDILIFYFSGHGIAVGRDDFGFCTSDTIFYDRTKCSLSLSVVKVTELLSSLNLGNIIPILIIDACYSGIAGRSLRVPPIDAISSINENVNKVAASSYALLCACSENQTTVDSPDGGFFSNLLTQVALQGLPKSQCNDPFLSLRDIFPNLQSKIQTITDDITPKLFLGQTLPDFPFTKNNQFKIREYSISPIYIRILEELWNNGNPRALEPEEIRSLCGNGAYGNHNKLSFEPWALVETIPQTKQRRLTERGIQFLLNKLEIPKTVIKDPKTKKIVADENTIIVRYSDFS